MARLRVGSVGYLNARPLTDEIDRERFEVLQDHPAGIAAALDAGEVDIALVPVAAVLQGAERRIAPGVCIGADGAVDSVLLVAESPPEAWTEVVLDGESRTSAVLAQLLLRRGPLSKQVADVAVRTVDPGTGVQSARGTVAALVIGDAARLLPDRRDTRVNLAEQWKAWTGLPFVFAVWAGRPDLDPGLVSHLRLAGERGVAAVADTWSGEDRVYLGERIRYALDDTALMGLRRFGALAKAEGLLPREDVELYGPSHRVIPRVEGVDALLERAVDGEALSFDEALQLEVGATLTSLAAAADLKRSLLHPRGRVGYRLDVPGAGEVVTVGAGESGADRVRALLALRDREVDTVRVVAAEQPGKPAASEANTAVDQLRATALARLLLQVPHLEASSATEGLGMAQAALSMGCDHFGSVVVGDGDRGAVVAEVERLIREAGFEVEEPGPVAVAPVPVAAPRA